MDGKRRERKERDGKRMEGKGEGWLTGGWGSYAGCLLAGGVLLWRKRRREGKGGRAGEARYKRRHLL